MNRPPEEMTIMQKLLANPRLAVPLAILVMLAVAASIAFAATVYDLVVRGAATGTGRGLQACVAATMMYTNNETWTLTSTSYGRTFKCPGRVAQTITLPANGAVAGSQMWFIGTGTDNYIPTFTAATADTLIVPNDATATSVSFDAGSRIGFYLHLISDGSKWVAINEGSTTMTSQ